ncbi:hypothetical protein CLAFUR4_08631 [Fulvia fulva]|nr:hypothetical protein CLAFUR4_08631 [Fulvia fulva]WPV27085.1 hypothetical protein CLAFUW7_08626 [Fulvia fulva]
MCSIEPSHKTSGFQHQHRRNHQPHITTMCQICSIKEAAAKERWPKPVEASKKDLIFLVDSIHTEYIQYNNVKRSTPNAPPPDALLDLCRMLSDQLDALEVDREAWWTSPEKRATRQRLEADLDQKRLSALHKINNSCIESIEGLSAKLGGFVKWSLNMNGGVWELMNGHKVAGA